jgi:hypothetical protein
MTARHAEYRRAYFAMHACVLVLFSLDPTSAFSEGGVRRQPPCQLDAEDAAIVQQARSAAAAACSGTDAASCEQAQAQLRQTISGFCSAEPCSLQISAMPVARNRVAAQSIEAFLEDASSTSMCPNGEIGSFRWSIGAQTSGPGHRFTTLVAGGTTMLPEYDGSGDADPNPDAPLILKAIRMITAHEARHRAAFLAVARQACADISSRVGDTKDIFQKYFCGTGPGSNAAAQRQVDLLDGITKLVVSADGKKDVVSHGADYDAGRYVTPGLCE